MSRLAIRCDGGLLPEIGTGHVLRAVSLANGLIAAGTHERADVVFATRRHGAYAPGYDMVRGERFAVADIADHDLTPNQVSEGVALAGLGAQLVVIDRLATDSTVVEAVRSKGSLVVTFDDTGSGGAAADLVVNAILAEGHRGSAVRRGYEYLLLPEHSYSPGGPASERVRSIAVSAGGFDARDIVGWVLESFGRGSDLGNFDGATIRCLVGDAPRAVVAGWRTRAEDLVRVAGMDVEVLVRPPEFKDLLRDADVCVVSGGLTVFECVAMGRPILGLPQYAHQLDTLCRLEAAGVAALGSRGFELDPVYFLSPWASSWPT